METLFFRQPRLVVLALFVIIVSGLSAVLTIGRQEDPTITNIFAAITTVYPGADPGRVEALVTAKIETRLRTIPEIAELSSTSATSVSVVLVELANTVPAARIEQVWAEIRDALSDVRRDFPAGVQEPEFNSDGAGGYAAIFAITVPEGHSLARAAREAEALADLLRTVPGTRLVDLHGAPTEEVLVTVDPARAASLGLTADAIAAAIRAADSKVQAGRLRGASSDLLLGVTGEITALDRLRRVVVREDAAGRAVLLGDIASVTRGAREPPTEAAIHRGERAILVSAKLEEGLQVDRWMARMRADAERFGAAMPAGLRVELVFDQSRYTAERLREIALNMAQGVALVVLVLFLTLGWRSALIVALALPVVTLVSFATLKALGIPIHQMSVTGLIVALGLLVDAAIVMVDDIGARLRRGAARIEAVSTSVRRLAMPLLASTVTTILSFLPLILLPGPAGDFVGSIAIAVVVMLAWSFVVAVTITPAIAGWWLRAADGSPRREGPLLRLFRASVRLSLANPIRAVALSLVLPVLGFVSLPTLTAQFFPGVDRDQFTIEVELPEGASLAQTARTVRAIDTQLRAEADIASVTWVLGRSAPAFYYNIVGNRDQAPGFAQALITTASPAATGRLLGPIPSLAAAGLPGSAAAAARPGAGAAGGCPGGAAPGRPGYRGTPRQRRRTARAPRRAAAGHRRAHDDRRRRAEADARHRRGPRAAARPRPRADGAAAGSRARRRGRRIAARGNRGTAGARAARRRAAQRPDRHRGHADPASRRGGALGRGAVPGRGALRARHAAADAGGERGDAPQRRAGEHRTGLPHARRAAGGGAERRAAKARRGRLPPARGRADGDGRRFRCTRRDRAGADRAARADRGALDRGGGADLQFLPAHADRLHGGRPVRGPVAAGARRLQLSPSASTRSSA
jgi:hypothetical protein